MFLKMPIFWTEGHNRLKGLSFKHSVITRNKIRTHTLSVLVMWNIALKIFYKKSIKWIKDNKFQ